MGVGREQGFHFASATNTPCEKNKTRGGGGGGYGKGRRGCKNSVVQKRLEKGKRDASWGGKRIGPGSCCAPKCPGR